jgi:hypothetical protein
MCLKVNPKKKAWQEKRGAVALFCDETTSFVGLTTVTLLTIQPLRTLLIDKAYLTVGKKYKISSCLGKIAKEIWSRSHGFLRPDGLLRFLSNKFDYSSKNTP